MRDKDNLSYLICELEHLVEFPDSILEGLLLEVRSVSRA